MRFTLPTRHVLYFGIQAKKDKLDAAGMPKSANTSIAEIHQQAVMMLDTKSSIRTNHACWSPRLHYRRRRDHEGRQNWIGQRLDAAQRSQVMFMPT